VAARAGCLGIVEERFDVSKDRVVPRPENHFTGAVDFHAPITALPSRRDALGHSGEPIVVPQENATLAKEMLNAMEVPRRLGVSVIAIDEDEVIRAAAACLVDVLGGHSVFIAEEPAIQANAQLFGGIETAFSVPLHFAVEGDDGPASVRFHHLRDEGAAQPEPVTDDEAVCRPEPLDQPGQDEALVFADADRTDGAAQAVVGPSSMHHPSPPNPLHARDRLEGDDDALDERPRWVG